MRAPSWYACRDAGGAWPVMFGPYSEQRARAEVAGLPGGFAVGFASNADRADFLRRWEDARTSPEARAAIVARLQEGDEDVCTGCPGGCLQCCELDLRDMVPGACDECERSNGPHYRGPCAHGGAVVRAAAVRRRRGRVALARWSVPNGASWQRVHMAAALARASVSRRFGLALEAERRAAAWREARIAVRYAARWREQAERRQLWPWGDEDARAFLSELDEMRRADR